MYDPFYDEEAIYQEADILQAQYEEESARMVADEKRGICHHSARFGYRPEPLYPEQEGLVYGQSRCRDCLEILEDPRCSEPDCELVTFNRGFCEKHWFAEYDRTHPRRATWTS